MPLDKTLTDNYRRKLDFDKYHVFEVLPGHFDDKYPELTKFLIKYYEALEENDMPTEALNDLLLSRDIVVAREEFLTFIANELLLGKPYFESFNDKRTALQYSNLLYRSKGTEYSIRQFFRIFYGFDIDVRYGKDEIFYIGDPLEELLIYEGEGRLGGSNFPYTFLGADVTVEVKNTKGEWVLLRQDLDYIMDFTNRFITLRRIDRTLVFVGTSSSEKVPAEEYLAPNDEILREMNDNAWLPEDAELRIVTVRKTQYTTIGADVTDKKITNNKFYQLYALLIETPVGVSTWREAYKTFVHPAGMYLAGQVVILSEYDFNLGPQPSIIEPPPPVEIIERAPIFDKLFRKSGILNTDITEIGPGPADIQNRGAQIRTQTNDMFSYKNVEKWHLQYQSIHRADIVDARTFDEVAPDLSNTINLLDENNYHWSYYDSAWNSNFNSRWDSYPTPEIPSPPSERIIQFGDEIGTEGADYVTTEQQDVMTTEITEGVGRYANPILDYNQTPGILDSDMREDNSNWSYKEDPHLYNDSDE